MINYMHIPVPYKVNTFNSRVTIVMCGENCNTFFALKLDFSSIHELLASFAFRFCAFRLIRSTEVFRQPN